MRRDEKRWRLRVGIEDRPGALAALATTLGVHDVDVQHIDVVSRGEVAVDDIWIELPPGGRIESLELVLHRLPGVSVRALLPVASAEDPVSVMAAACALAARASSLEALRDKAVLGACLVGSAEHAVLVRPIDDGSLRVLSATRDVAGEIATHEPCLAREAAFGGLPMAVPGSYPWAPQGWRAAIDAAWVAAVPLASGGAMSSCLMIVRERAFAFESGELARLADFGRVLTALTSPHESSSETPDAAAWMLRGGKPDTEDVLIGAQ